MWCQILSLCSVRKSFAPSLRANMGSFLKGQTRTLNTFQRPQKIVRQNDKISKPYKIMRTIF